jgi:DNA-binding transcriptional MocR family regulator
MLIMLLYSSLGLAEWTIPKGGLFLWMRLLGDGKDPKIVVACERGLMHGVLVIPGNAFVLYKDKPCPYIRISYSLVSSQDIDEVSTIDIVNIGASAAKPRTRALPQC